MQLQINQYHDVDVDPTKRYQATQIEVSPGERYLFTARGTWRDASITCGPEGWRNWWTPYLQRFSRLPKQDFFYLGGNIGQQEDSNFPIGPSATVTIPVAGTLFLFANDLWYLYGNNHRVPKQPMPVNIRRVS